MDNLNNNEKNKLWSLFQNIDKTTLTDSTSVLKNEVLLVDGLNTFIRAWAVSTAMNDNGVHTGGITGFLKSVDRKSTRLNSSH